MLTMLAFTDNYYDTCYSTTDIRRRQLKDGIHGGMTPVDRKAHIEYLRNGGEFGAAVHVGQVSHPHLTLAQPFT